MKYRKMQYHTNCAKEKVILNFSLFFIFVLINRLICLMFVPLILHTEPALAHRAYQYTFISTEPDPSLKHRN